MCSKSTLKQIFDTLTDNGPEIKLEETDRSGAIVHGIWNATTFKKWTTCSFKVDANPVYKYGRSRGIYVTVNKVKLRQWSGSGDCIDYVQFKTGDNHKSIRICGDYEATGGYTNDQTKFFIDDYGHTNVDIKFDDHAVVSGDQQFEIVLIFTAFKKGLLIITHTYSQYW